MKPQIALVETARPSAEREITAAYHGMLKGEKLCLEFGRVCCEWRDKFQKKKTAGPQTKGTGLAQILSQLGCNEAKAYYWMNRYENSIGVVTTSNYNKAGTRGFQDRLFVNRLIRHCRALAETPGGCSPFPVLIDKAFAECELEEARGVIIDMRRAIKTLAEHCKKFETKLGDDDVLWTTVDRHMADGLHDVAAAIREKQ